MSKRQKRFNRSAISAASSEITGKTINIVMVSKSVFHARIISIEGDVLRYENDRKKVKTIRLDEVEEIILDY